MPAISIQPQLKQICQQPQADGWIAVAQKVTSMNIRQLRLYAAHMFPIHSNSPLVSFIIMTCTASYTHITHYLCNFHKITILML